MTTLAEALAARPVVLDGGLSTELESRGHDVTS
ncbi:homocysteine S-methyltransferase, partial [Modestobacter versicolor]